MRNFNTTIVKYGRYLDRTGCGKGGEHEDHGYKQEVQEIKKISEQNEGLVSQMQGYIARQIQRHRDTLKIFGVALVLIGYLVFLGFAINYNLEGSLALIVFTSLAVISLLYKLIRDNYGFVISKILFHPISRIWDKHWNKTKW